MYEIDRYESRQVAGGFNSFSGGTTAYDTTLRRLVVTFSGAGTLTGYQGGQFPPGFADWTGGSIRLLRTAAATGAWTLALRSRGRDDPAFINRSLVPATANTWTQIRLPKPQGRYFENSLHLFTSKFVLGAGETLKLRDFWYGYRVRSRRKGVKTIHREHPHPGVTYGSGTFGIGFDSTTDVIFARHVRGGGGGTLTGGWACQFIIPQDFHGFPLRAIRFRTRRNGATTSFTATLYDSDAVADPGANGVSIRPAADATWTNQRLTPTATTHRATTERDDRWILLDLSSTLPANTSHDLGDMRILYE